MYRLPVIIVFLCSLLAKLPATAQLSNTGLVVYLPLNGNAQDISGNNYNGFADGAIPTTDASGTPNAAMYFDRNSKITIPNPFLLRGRHDEITILMRVYVDTLYYRINSSTFQYFFSWFTRRTQPSAQNFSLFDAGAFADELLYPPPLHPVWGAFCFVQQQVCSNSSMGYAFFRDSGRMIRQWFTYAFVFNRSNAKQYFNCKKMSEDQLNYGQFPALCNTDTANEISIVLGNYYPLVPGYSGQFFSGKIDELRIYKRALRDDEIEIYANGFCKPEIEPIIGLKKKNCSQNELTITDESVTNGVPVTNRQWHITRDNFTLTGTGSFDYVFTRTGSYTVYLDLTDHEGYHYQKDTTFFVNTGPREHFIKSPQNIYTLCGDKKSLDVTLTGATSYQWSPCTGVSDCNSGTVTITPTTDQVYQVSGINADGCKDTISITVKKSNNDSELFVPSAFTPNNDGVNDVLGVQSATPPGKFEFSIYNRWGERVFHTGYALATWNGSYNYKRQPAGVYLWQLKYGGGPGCPTSVKKGTVMLIR